MAKTTHIIAVLDRSGSMGHLAVEVISNFNHFLKEQQSVEGKAKLTLVLFDDKYEVVYDETDLMEVPPLTEDVYYTRGMTAMNDAIGKILSDKQKKKKGLVFIHTDGLENASREWTTDQVKSEIKKLEKKWDFIFAGANIDALAEGGARGFAATNTINVANNAAGIQRSYANASAKAMAYRTAGINASSTLDMESVQSFADVEAAVKTATENAKEKS